MGDETRGRIDPPAGGGTTTWGSGGAGGHQAASGIKRPTATELGRDIQNAGRSAPAPYMTASDVARFDGKVQHLEGYSRPAFVASKNGYGTLYVDPTLPQREVRNAYREATGRDTAYSGRDVDHSWPKARAAEVGAYGVAVGDIPAGANRSHGAMHNTEALAAKGMGLDHDTGNSFMTSTRATARQLGRLDQNGYLFKVADDNE